ncbi:MAG: hypothetical protein ACT4OX_09545 [Actinomycetota bacterium]
MVVIDRDEIGSVAPAAASDVPAPPPDTVETVLTRQVRYFVAICSFAAGILHLLAMAAHADHHPTVGRAFLATAVLQIIWGGLLLVEPRRIVIAVGAIATAGAITAWVFTRTKGISWFPGFELPEPIEWRDVVTQFFQLLAIAGAVVLLAPAGVHKPAGKQIEFLPIAIMSLLALGTLGVLYGATHGYVHHDHQPGSVDEGHPH